MQGTKAYSVGDLKQYGNHANDGDEDDNNDDDDGNDADDDDDDGKCVDVFVGDGRIAPSPPYDEIIIKSY